MEENQHQLDISVEGKVYQPEFLFAMLANLVSALQIACIAFAFFGDYIFQAMKIEPPSFYATFKEKKTFIMIGVFFGGNMISQQLTNTGAFEVIMNG